MHGGRFVGGGIGAEQVFEQIGSTVSIGVGDVVGRTGDEANLARRERAAAVQIGDDARVVERRGGSGCR